MKLSCTALRTRGVKGWWRKAESGEISSRLCAAGAVTQFRMWTERQGGCRDDGGWRVEVVAAEAEGRRDRRQWDVTNPSTKLAMDAALPGTATLTQEVRGLNGGSSMECF